MVVFLWYACAKKLYSRALILLSFEQFCLFIWKDIGRKNKNNKWHIEFGKPEWTGGNVSYLTIIKQCTIFFPQNCKTASVLYMRRMVTQVAQVSANNDLHKWQDDKIIISDGKNIISNYINWYMSAACETLLCFYQDALVFLTKTVTWNYVLTQFNMTPQTMWASFTK